MPSTRRARGPTSWGGASHPKRARDKQAGAPGASSARRFSERYKGRQSFTIIGALGSQNELLRAHWSRSAKAGTDAKWLAFCAIKAAEIRPAGLPLEIRITWIEDERPRGRRRDLDNLVAAGTKYVVDALVDAGVLEDDGPDYIRRFVHDLGDPEAGKARIEVELIPISTLPKGRRRK